MSTPDNDDPGERARLDAQYNLRALVPEHPRFFERWARDSAATRRQLACRADVRYGASEAERLDFFPAAANGAPSPLLAFIHGGYWRSLDARDFDYLAPPFVGAGIAFASLNYGLAPAVSVADIVRQCRAALAWLWRNAAELAVDGERIYVAGHSAGGHLTAMMALTDWFAVDPGLPTDFVKGGCAVSGLYDLDPIRRCYLNDDLGLDAASARRLSPLSLLDRKRPPAPLILAVGSEETAAFLRQQDAFAAAWRAHGFDCHVVELPGCNHFSAIDALGDADHRLNAAVRAMLMA
jgi:arylformamidase